MEGWIKLHRQLTEWEWYSDVNTTRVFLHLLMVANHKDGKWRGIQIKRGQRLTSLSKLADETSLSIKNVRTSIKRLKSTCEVASHSTAMNTMITVLNYELYQGAAHETASCGQGDGKLVATNKNVKNEKNENNIDYSKVKDVFNKYFCEGVDPVSKEKLFPATIKQLTPKRKKVIDSFFKQAKLDLKKFEGYVRHVSTSQSWLYLRKVNVKNGKTFAQRPFEYYMKLDVFVAAVEEATNNE